MKKLKYNQKRQMSGLLFIAPWVIGFILFYVKPISQLMVNSLEEIKVTSEGTVTSYIGLKNFVEIFTVNPDFNKALVSSVSQTILSLPFIVIFSLIIAVVLNSEFKGRGIARVIFILPLILGLDLIVSLGSLTNIGDQVDAITNVSSGLQAGQLEVLLLASSIPEWISNLLITMVNGVFDIISLSGVQILIFLSALQSVNPALYEVAQIEGANAYEIFWKVTIPGISPMIFMVIIYTIIDAYYRSPLASNIHSAAFTDGNFGASSAMSLTLLAASVFTLLLAILLTRGLVKNYE